MRVLLFSTIHEEQGLATVSALNAILERVRPDVIFLEIPEAAFADYDVGLRSNLESRAARQYREWSDVALVPVDLPAPEESFFRDIQYLDRRIATTSPDYRRLVDQNSHDVAAYGFPYLNSERSTQAWFDIYEAMQAAIQRLNHDTRLNDIFESWTQTNERREKAILKNIAEYSLRRPFENGALLIGAAHRQSIINKSRGGSGAADTPRIECEDLNAP